MACGNNQVSRQGLLSDPRPLSQPSPAGLGDPSPQRAAAREQQVTRAQQRVVEAKAAIEAATSGRTIQKALADARAALNDARRSGHRARVRELEREVAALTTRAKARSTFSRATKAPAAGAEASLQLPSNIASATHGAVTDGAKLQTVYSSAAGRAAVQFTTDQTCLVSSTTYGPSVGCVDNAAITAGQRALWNADSYFDGPTTVQVVAPDGVTSVSAPGTDDVAVNAFGAARFQIKGDLPSLTLHFADGRDIVQKIQ